MPNERTFLYEAQRPTRSVYPCGDPQPKPISINRRRVCVGLGAGGFKQHGVRCAPPTHSTADECKLGCERWSSPIFGSTCRVYAWGGGSTYLIVRVCESAGVATTAFIGALNITDLSRQACGSRAGDSGQ